ncbi:Uncharacterised protein [Clostridioides difficile]|nr:Uncharacterised protein [Clostridioides difficile]
MARTSATNPQSVPWPVSNRAQARAVRRDHPRSADSPVRRRRTATRRPPRWRAGIPRARRAFRRVRRTDRRSRARTAGRGVPAGCACVPIGSRRTPGTTVPDPGSPSRWGSPPAPETPALGRDRRDWRGRRRCVRPGSSRSPATASPRRSPPTRSGS